MGKNPSKAKLFKELEIMYYHPDEEGSYGGIQKLLRAANGKRLKVSEKSIKYYLGRQANYCLHKQSRKNFKRNQTVGRTDPQWQADLAHMQALSRKNKGTKYILTVSDVFSKYASAIPLKNKCGPEKKNVFALLFQMSTPGKLDKIQTDAGNEFLYMDVQKF